jgi:predicted PurR-regulated permease PerM
MARTWAASRPNTHGWREERVPVRTILTTIGLVLVSLFLVWLVITAQRVLVWTAVAGFFAIALYPVVNWVEQHLTRGRRSLATILVFFVAAVVLLGILAAIVVPLTRQATQLADDLPAVIEDIRTGRGPVGNMLERTNVLQFVQEHEDSVRQQVSELGTPALGIIKAALTGVVGVITVFVLAYLMVLEGPVFIDALLNLFEPRTADRISRVGSDCAKTITGYLSGNLLISIICGLLTYAVLRIVGAPLAGLVALFVAIMDLIPLVGATIGALAAGAAGFLHSVPAGITVIVVFVIYQQVENHFLQPVIYARTVKLNPLTVILAILVAVQVAGVLGALLAIPVAGMISIIGRDIWDYRRGGLKSEPTVGEDHLPASRAEP